jgi:hypothetical protein
VPKCELSEVRKNIKIDITNHMTPKVVDDLLLQAVKYITSLGVGYI